MTYKITIVIALLSFFAFKAHSFKKGCTLSDHKNDPSVTFVWKNKCHTRSTTFVCSGGFKPDANFLKDWKNKSTQKNVIYEFSQPVSEELPYYFRTGIVEPILEKSCNQGCFGNADIRLDNNSIETCTKPNEQAITFHITSPDQSAVGLSDNCNAAGGAEWIGVVYPKAKWEDHPALPHYYFYQASSVNEYKSLAELIVTQRENSKGCFQYEFKRK